MNGETIELPAGLVDADEDPVVAALRELKEETGYVGTVTRMGNGTDGDDESDLPRTTPALPLSPGLSDETVALVRVDVDLDSPENKNPTQELEGSEFITVLTGAGQGTSKDFGRFGQSRVQRLRGALHDGARHGDW